MKKFFIELKDRFLSELPVWWKKLQKIAALICFTSESVKQQPSVTAVIPGHILDKLAVVAGTAAVVAQFAKIDKTIVDPSVIPTPTTPPQA